MWFGGRDAWEEDWWFYVSNEHTLISICRGHAMHHFERFDPDLLLDCVICFTLFLSALVQNRHPPHNGLVTYGLWVCVASIALVAYDFLLRFMATSPCLQPGGCLHKYVGSVATAASTRASRVYISRIHTILRVFSLSRVGGDRGPRPRHVLRDLRAHARRQLYLGVRAAGLLLLQRREAKKVLARRRRGRRVPLRLRAAGSATCATRALKGELRRHGPMTSRTPSRGARRSSSARSAPSPPRRARARSSSSSARAGPGPRRRRGAQARGVGSAPVADAAARRRRRRRSAGRGFVVIRGAHVRLRACRTPGLQALTRLCAPEGVGLGVGTDPPQAASRQRAPPRPRRALVGDLCTIGHVTGPGRWTRVAHVDAGVARVDHRDIGPRSVDLRARGRRRGFRRAAEGAASRRP